MLTFVISFSERMKFNLGHLRKLEGALTIVNLTKLELINEKLDGF
jgi:hypothetical protein